MCLRIGVVPEESKPTRISECPEYTEYRIKNIMKHKKRIFVDSDQFVDLGRSTGFTLVELIVAMSVFIVATTFASGVFIQGLRSQRLLTQAIAVNNEMGVVLEQMAREIRVGHQFSGVGGVGETLSFQTDEGGVVYTLLDGVITRNGAKLTSRDVEVTALRFLTEQSGCEPWRVVMSLDVRAAGSDGESLPIQTTVSSRVLPVDLEVDGNGDGINDFAECRSNIVRR